MANKKDYSQDDLADVPSPENANLDYDAAQHQVPLPEVAQVLEAVPLPEAPVAQKAEEVEVEVVESPRKIKAAPAPKLPFAVAQALGVAPEGTIGDDARRSDGASPSPSMFWDDETYRAATVQAGDVEIRLRELSEETLYFVTSINARINEATEGRVSEELSAHLFSGLKSAPAQMQNAARAITVDDSVLIKTMIASMRDRALCEGIVSWEPAPRPCTDENKLKLGRKIRDECLTQIFKISTFGEKEQDFLEGS